VIDVLPTLWRDRPLLVIAHQLPTVSPPGGADQIVVLDSGWVTRPAMEAEGRVRGVLACPSRCGELLLDRTAARSVG
jgi:ABC-type transport system involved in cytochrome bd biosynthesis fused ATPase/permease subunit